MFRSHLLALTALHFVATATASLSSAASIILSHIPAQSARGSRLLSKARLLNNNNDDATSYTWVADYSLQFQSCHTTLEFRADGDSNDGQDNAPTESMRLVHFKLCPTDKCGSSCRHGADYVVEMREFVESYLEFQMNQKEYNCEQVQENCSCDDAADDETCLTQCYQDAGLDGCENEEENGFEVDGYLECTQVGDNNNNNNGGSSTSLYVGAYCSDNGKNIFLGTFSDRQCTQHTSASAFESVFGTALPYTSTSLVTHDCLSCLEPAEYDDDAYQNNGDKNDGDTVREICEELYQRSAKCEKNLVQETQNTAGCDYLFRILPQEERVAKGGKPASFAFAWIFFLTTVALSVYAFTLYKKANRGTIHLLSEPTK